MKLLGVFLFIATLWNYSCALENREVSYCAGDAITELLHPTAYIFPVYISTYVPTATVLNINNNINITIHDAPTVIETLVNGTSIAYGTATASNGSGIIASNSATILSAATLSNGGTLSGVIQPITPLALVSETAISSSSTELITTDFVTVIGGSTLTLPTTVTSVIVSVSTSVSTAASFSTAVFFPPPPPFGVTSDSVGVPFVLKSATTTNTKLRKRQASSDTYVKGATLTTSCRNGTSFVLAGGQLFGEGSVVAGNPNMTEGSAPPFMPGMGGDVVDGFQVDSTGMLSWNNSKFPNEMAGFCLDNVGTLRVVFDTNKPPPGCDSLNLNAVPRSLCYNSTSTTAGSPSGTNTAGDGNTPFTFNTQLFGMPSNLPTSLLPGSVASTLGLPTSGIPPRPTQPGLPSGQPTASVITALNPSVIPSLQSEVSDLVAIATSDVSSLLSLIGTRISGAAVTLLPSLEAEISGLVSTLTSDAALLTGTATADINALIATILSDIPILAADISSVGAIATSLVPTLASAVSAEATRVQTAVGGILTALVQGQTLAASLSVSASLPTLPIVTPVVGTAVSGVSSVLGSVVSGVGSVVPTVPGGGDPLLSVSANLNPSNTAPLLSVSANLGPLGTVAAGAGGIHI